MNRTEVSPVLATLQAGRPAVIGQVSLHPDVELGLVWGVDPYGMDCIAAQADGNGALDFIGALEWAKRQNAPSTHPHPADFSW